MKLTDSVDVVLAVVGVVVVDDELDIVHVQPTGSYVCGHQDVGGPGPEVNKVKFDFGQKQIYDSRHIWIPITFCCGAGPF